MRRRRLLVLITVIFGLGVIWPDLVWSQRGSRPLAPSALGKTADAPASANRPAFTPVERLSPAGGQNAPYSWDHLVRSVNISNGPARLSALLQLARRAETQGLPHLAVKVYTLAASLYPESPEAGHARLRRLVIEFYLALGGVGDPYVSFHNFLINLSELGLNFPAAELREPLVAGWAALEPRGLGQSPCSGSLLEKVLTLWELQPAGARPPEAALLVGRLLKSQGLFEEAKPLLVLARQNGTHEVQAQALAELLQLAWISQGLPGFLKSFRHWRQQEPADLLLALRTWPLGLASQGAGGPEFEGLSDWQASLPPAPNLISTLDKQLWLALLGQSLPPVLQEYLVRDAARHFWLKGNFAKAGQLYRDALAILTDKEIAVFYWDRLGLAHVRDHQPELAQDIFQTLARDHGPFWRLVAATRQLDLELLSLLSQPAL